MKKKTTPKERRLAGAPAPKWSCANVGLDADLYAAALRYLFDRPEVKRMRDEWYWSIDESEFNATALEWTLIQTVLFANAGEDLAAYSDEQVGMGLNYLMNCAVSDVANQVSDSSVPLLTAMNMMQAFPHLWRDCIGPRLAHLHAPIGGSEGGRLGFVCYMWFDVWPTFWQNKHSAQWRDAHWSVLSLLLDVPCREVQIAALHGIGHDAREIGKNKEIEKRMNAYIRQIRNDEELLRYAQAAAVGHVL